MDITWKEKYKHTNFTLTPNKKSLPINKFTFNDEDVKKFNEIYRYCKRNYSYVPPTNSGGIANSLGSSFHERYTVVSTESKQHFELIIACEEGCYRFVLKSGVAETNTVTGRKACVEMYKQFDAFNIDVKKYMTGNLEIKKEIKPPHIEFLLPDLFLRRPIKNCHHLDLNSAYASGIIKDYPELRDVYEHVYSKRKENNNYFKHVLTNSIGCFQSEFCVDYETRFRAKPYALANLSKSAINNTRARIEQLIIKLKRSGRTPILTNTDGIWYSGDVYTAGSGDKLGEFKNDHTNCTLLVKTRGAYQFIENGKVHSVVRGLSNLDKLHERDEWEFGEILRPDICISAFKFDVEKGVVKVWLRVQ